MNRCRDCDDGLAHCHGTLIRHDDGTVECSQSPYGLEGTEHCGGDAVQHLFQVECAEVLAGCCAEGATWRLAS